MSYVFKKDLFTRGKTRLCFNVSACADEDDLNSLIEFGGGRLGDAGGPYTITLLNCGTDINIATPDRDVFKSDFIIKCCLKNCLLPLENFRINETSLFTSDFNPNEILLQERTWEQVQKLYKKKPLIQNLDSFCNPSGCIVINGLFPVVCLSKVLSENTKKTEKEGETMHNVSHDSDSVNVCSNLFSDKKVRKETGRPHSKRIRNEYTPEERVKILQFICTHLHSSDELRQPGIWKKMVEEVPRHSWESLKEHFKKKIYPFIADYNLPDETISKIRLGMNGLKVEILISSESEIKVTDTVKSRRKKRTKISCSEAEDKNLTLLKRSPQKIMSSLSDTEDLNSSNLKENDEGRKRHLLKTIDKATCRQVSISEESVNVPKKRSPQKRKLSSSDSEEQNSACLKEIERKKFKKFRKKRNSPAIARILSQCYMTNHLNCSSSSTNQNDGECAWEYLEDYIIHPVSEESDEKNTGSDSLGNSFNVSPQSHKDSLSTCRSPLNASIEALASSDKVMSPRKSNHEDSPCQSPVKASIELQQPQRSLQAGMKNQSRESSHLFEGTEFPQELGEALLRESSSNNQDPGMTLNEKPASVLETAKPPLAKKAQETITATVNGYEPLLCCTKTSTSGAQTKPVFLLPLPEGWEYPSTFEAAFNLLKLANLNQPAERVEKTNATVTVPVLEASQSANLNQPAERVRRTNATVTVPVLEVSQSPVEKKVEETIPSTENRQGTPPCSTETTSSAMQTEPINLLSLPEGWEYPSTYEAAFKLLKSVGFAKPSENIEGLPDMAKTVHVSGVTESPPRRKTEVTYPETVKARGTLSCSRGGSPSSVRSDRHTCSAANLSQTENSQESLSPYKRRTRSSNLSPNASPLSSSSQDSSPVRKISRQTPFSPTISHNPVKTEAATNATPSGSNSQDSSPVRKITRRTPLSPSVSHNPARTKAAANASASGSSSQDSSPVKMITRSTRETPNLSAQELQKQTSINSFCMASSGTDNLFDSVDISPKKSPHSKSMKDTKSSPSSSIRLTRFSLKKDERTVRSGTKYFKTNFLSEH